MEYAGHHCTFFFGCVCVCLGLDRVAGRVSFLIVHNLVDTFARVGSLSLSFEMRVTVVVLVRKLVFSSQTKRHTRSCNAQTPI
jgi:hypothetical protein